MYDNYNYPPGADNASAPWNEREIPEQRFDCEVSVTLTRNSSFFSEDYCCDEDGCDLLAGADTVGAYNEQHKSIPDLLVELEKYICGELQGNISRDRRHELEQMLDDCRGWQVYETEIDM